MRRVESRGGRRRVDLVVLGAFVLAAVAAPPSPAEGPAAKSLYVSTRTGCLDPGFEELACGALGPFFVGTGEDCGQSSSVDVSGSGLYIETPDAISVRSSDEAWTPCPSGRCFSDDPRGPWVAVIDWDNGHGQSVGETIRQASDFSVAVRLFALEASGLDVIDSLPGVNDAHVLAQLCRVAQEAAVDPPLAVNMSFGRLHSAASCESHVRGLACELDRVLEHLRHDLHIPLFAAAGQEGELLFPAADPRVLAVGEVDLGHLAATGEARRLPQTPRGVDALFAGQGVYLESPDGEVYWGAPPGSSYASALAAGWWAGYRVRAPRLADKLLGFCRSVLAPKLAGGSVYLACGSLALPDSDLAGPEEILRAALGERPEACGGRVPDDGMPIEVEGPAEAPRLTLADIQAQLSRPAPDSRPCVPCHGSGGGGDNGSGGARKSDTMLTVDLSASQGIPDELELLGIYLRVGRMTFRFSDSENPNLLGELALGRVERLTLANVPLRPDTPLAFVFALRLRRGGLAFRSTTPILVHEHKKEL